MSFLDDLFGSPETNLPFEGTADSLGNLLKNSLTKGFAPFGGDRVANLTPEQQEIMGAFFSTIFPMAMQGLGDVASQDSAARLEALLAPATQRATDATKRDVRERSNLGNNLFSTGAAFNESEAVSNIRAQQLATIAQLLPQLDQLRLGAIGAMPGMTGQALSIGDMQRQIQQQELDAAFAEFMRTNPRAGGGPLQAAMALFGGQGFGSFQQQPNWMQNLLGAGASFFGGPGGAAVINKMGSGGE